MSRCTLEHDVDVETAVQILAAFLPYLCLPLKSVKKKFFFQKTKQGPKHVYVIPIWSKLE